MNNLINMSDHEKVIFVTGIDESRNIELAGGIKTLATDYPFAIFFTSDDTASATAKYPIMNIWKGGLINGEIQGVRLTRFIGIDEENNTLQLGDHTVKLLFDYETGKLGLYDANKLESLELFLLTYRDVNNGRIREITYPETHLINAKDNKFTLTFRFKSTDDGDPRKISNTLNVENGSNESDFSLASKSNSSYSEAEHYVDNVYIYDIKRDTYKELNNALNYKTYNFISQYASDKYDSTKLCFILNPISYTLSYRNMLLGSVITQIGTNLTEPAMIDVNFMPSNVTSYPTRKLYMKITSENPEYIKVCNENGIDTNEFEILEGVTKFWLKPADNIINETISTTLNIDIEYIFNGTRYTYTDLSKTITIILTGETLDTFWYAGFDDPTSTGFDVNNLLMFNSEDLNNDETYFLYNWNNDISVTDRIETRNFFIAIPYTYKDIIKPRWDAYHIDRITNKKIYEECTNWFDVLHEHYTIKNIDFIIYKSLAFTGNFYGKIK